MIDLILFALFIIIWGALEVRDYLQYTNFKKKKFSDLWLFFFLFLYVLIYFPLHFWLLTLDTLSFLGKLSIGCLFLYMGIAAIQRREYTLFRGGAEMKGEGVKWIGIIWIIISIIWMVIV